MIAAVTPALDRHYSIFNSLGERFLQVRSHRPDSEVAGEWAIEQQGQEQTIRNEARSIIEKIFAGALKAPPKLSKGMRERIAAVSEIVAKARTHVYRSAFGNREMEHVPEPEANTRISKGLAAIARGGAALNQHEEVGEEEFKDIVRVAFDSMPENRRRLLNATIEGRSSDSVPMPETVRKRELEEMEALGLLTIDATDEFKLDSSVRKLLNVARIGGEAMEMQSEEPESLGVSSEKVRAA